MTLADLQADDRVVVQHIARGTVHEATALSVDRVVTTEGIVRDIALDDATRQPKLTLELGAGNKATVVLPFADSCEIVINNLASIAERRLRPADLLPGDQATVLHDTHVVRLAAVRVFHDRGIVDKVRANALDVMRQGERQPTGYTTTANCTITINNQPAELGDLRGGDPVEITHHSLDRRSPAAVAVAVQRAIDRSRWAIVVGIAGLRRPIAQPVGIPGGRRKAAPRHAGGAIPGS